MPDKALQPKNERTSRRVFSVRLAQDSRVMGPPRHVGKAYIAPKGGGLSVFVKIYAVLETPGTELMTVSVRRNDEKAGGRREYEFAFDERFAMPIHFRKMSDEERVSYAVAQINRSGGFEKLAAL